MTKEYSEIDTRAHRRPGEMTFDMCGVELWNIAAKSTKYLRKMSQQP